MNAEDITARCLNFPAKVESSKRIVEFLKMKVSLISGCFGINFPFAEIEVETVTCLLFIELNFHSTF